MWGKQSNREGHLNTKSLFSDTEQEKDVVDFVVLLDYNIVR